MFVNTYPKFSLYKSYVCSTMLKKLIKSFNETVLCTNHKRYPV